MEGQATVILAALNNTALRGVGGWVTGAPNAATFHMSLKVEGSKVTCENCISIYHFTSGNHNAYVPQKITAIYGLF